MVLRTLNIEGLPADALALKGDPHHLAPLVRDVLTFAKPERILDATAGSGVTARVADERAIPCVTSDLNDPREGIDLFTRDESDTYDLIVYHPDLWYSRETAAHPHDLGARRTWDEYVDLNADAVEHLAHLLRDNGRLLIVAPITRRRSRVRSLACALIEAFGAPREPMIVHPHANPTSSGMMRGNKFIPIAHDEVLLYLKEELLGGPVPADDDAPEK